MKKIGKVWQSKFFRNYVILISSFLLLEIFFRSVSDLSLISYASLRILLFLNVFALFFSFILSFCSNKVSKIFNILIILLLTIYGIAQLGFKSYLGVYVSIQSSGQAEAVTSYIWDFIKSFHLSYYLLLIPLLLVLIYYIFVEKRVVFDMPKKIWNMTTSIVKGFQFLIIVFFSLGFLVTLKLDFMQNKTQAITDYELFLKPNNPSLLVNDFGFIGFGFLDIKETFFPGKEITDKIDYDPNKIPTNNNQNSVGTPETPVFSNQLSINNDIWIKIIENESNANKNTLNKYFISKTPTKTNEYTGILENKNLVMIMIESGGNLMINEEYYPNIYKLYNEGISFDNYYSPRNTCSTINNELTNLTGLFTINNNCTANYYKNNTYFNSIFNLFNNKGYVTNSLHDNYDAYYPRTVIHKNLGSGRFYKVQDLNIKYSTDYGDWASDEDFMNAYLNILDNRDMSKPFMSFLTTVSSHMPYTDKCKFNTMYADMFSSDLPKDVRAYMSKLKVVDNAIGILIDGLKERGIFDDTAIVLFADHYPYGISKSNLSKAFGYDISIDNEAEKVPFIIYNSSLKKEHISKYTEHVNTTPTIANLFNLDYDSRIYMGSDVLSNEYESITIFDDGSWKNEYAYYDASNNKVHYYANKVYSEEEILAINEKVSLKLKMSSLAIKSNYFDYLEEKLNSYAATSKE